MRPEEQFTAFQRNYEAHLRGDALLTAEKLCEMLDDVKGRWHVVWEEMPRDIAFESLYAMRMSEPTAEKRWPFLFRQVADDSSTHAVISYEEIDGKLAWYPFIGPDHILNWLISHEPFGMAAIANLYAYSRTFESPKAFPPFAPVGTPWMLFCALVGQRKLVNGVVPDKRIKGGISLTRLVPLKDLNDAELLGQALTTFYNHVDIALAYIHLLDAYDSHRPVE